MKLAWMNLSCLSGYTNYVTKLLKEGFKAKDNRLLIPNILKHIISTPMQLLSQNQL